VTGETVAFWVVAAALLASSLAVVLTPNLFHAVLYLAAALVATGLVFLLLDAPFLFGVQLLLYAGGVVTIGREAQLGEDLHARAVLLRVLRAVRAGVPDRRDHHAEDVRPGDDRPA